MENLLVKSGATIEELNHLAQTTLAITYMNAYTWNEGQTNLSASPEQIINQARKIAEPLVQWVEEIEPHGRFGENKVREMNGLVHQAEAIGSEIGLNEHQTNILKVILGVHDTGRHIEKLLDLNTTRPGQRHGSLSLLFLEENKLLETLNLEDRYIVSFAVYYHSEKDVPKPTIESSDFEKLAYTMCYVLRDLDKEHLFNDINYLTPQGIFEQITEHYLTPSQRKSVSADELHLQILTTINSALKNNDVIESQHPVINYINKILNTGVSTEVTTYFESQQLIPTQLLKQSWASYLAYRLGMIFDIQNISVLKRVLIKNKSAIDASLNFINLKDPKSARVISNTLSSHIHQLGIM